MESTSLTAARAELVRARVLDGVALVLDAGDELTFARVARAAGVPERTVYRHFPNRDALMAALFHWTNERVGFAGDAPTTGAAMTTMVQRVFPGFDSVRPVIEELLRTPEGRRARLAALAERRAAAEAVVADRAPHIDLERRHQLAAVIQILGTATTWQALHDFWGLDGDAAAAAVTTAIDLLLDAAGDH
jgi:AcrR family transcriptional regulator